MKYRYSKSAAIKEKYAAGEQKSRYAMEECGPGRRGFIFCPHGEAVYYKKSWHHAEKFFRNPPKLGDKAVKFKLCPAHEMLKNKQYEGEVVIKNVPVKFRQELLNLIENFGERAMRRDVLDRIITIHVVRNTIQVTTSENQLAQRLAQKISEVFRNKVAIKISRAKEGDVVKIGVDFMRAI